MLLKRSRHNLTLGSHQSLPQILNVDVQFSISPALLYRAQRAIAREVPWIRWAKVLLIAGFPLLSLSIGLALGESLIEVLRTNWWSIVGFPACWLIGLPLLQRWDAARLFRATPALQSEQRYVFGEESIRAHSDWASTELAWAGLTRVVETPDFFLLFPSAAMAHFLPKEAFRSADDLHRFRLLVVNSVGVRARMLASPPSPSATAS
jgi:hypothetical protein